MLHVHCSFDTFEWCFQGWHELLWYLQFLIFLHHIQVLCIPPWHLSKVFHWWSQRIKDKCHNRRHLYFYLVIRHKKVHVYAHNFSVSCFSSFDIHQSQYLDGWQAMGTSSSFIENFLAFCFLYPSYYSNKLYLSSSSSCNSKNYLYHHHTTQKIYLYHHHTTYLSTLL